MSSIKNIILDLGGVLLNLDYGKTRQAFIHLGVTDFDNYFTQVHANPLFSQLETGAVVDPGFYAAIRNAAGISATDEAIDHAWNAMLLDFPEDRVQLLRRLGSQYRLFLFSNTNAIHLKSLKESFQALYGFDLDSLFEKAWYSHLIGHRKPTITSFEYILKDAGIQATETLFIDDTLQNVEAAWQAGIHAEYLSGEPLSDMLHRMGL